MPVNAAEPLGHPILKSSFVDSNHTGGMVTRWSQTGFFMYLNNVLIDWYSKWHLDQSSWGQFEHSGTN